VWNTERHVRFSETDHAGNEKKRDGAYVLRGGMQVDDGAYPMAENAVVQAWSWIGEQGAGRGQPSLSDEAGHPGI